jgi:cellulose synthase/poly-beta-1,6-N-acetylglucosamine synthase-like glycosyltransferase/peptidoglycan/xylan/chitin deacetylase (PgdA/CDA1 family)
MTCTGALAFIATSAVYLTGILIAPRWIAPPLETQIVLPSDTSLGHGMASGGRPEFASRHRALPASAGSARRIAFVWGGEAAATGQLRAHASELDGIIVDLLTVRAERDGGAVAVAEHGHGFMRWKARHAPQVAAYALLTQSGSSGRLAPMMATADGRTELAGDLVSKLRLLGSQGLAIDARSVADSSHADLVKLLHELRQALQSAGLSLLVVTGRDLPASRLRELGRPADLVVLQLFNDAGEGAPAAPLAPQGWFEAQLAHHVKVIDSAKLVIGIGAFALETDESGFQKRHSIQAAWDLARERGARIELDAVSLNPTFSFRDEDGRRRTIWMLDAVSGFNQARAALGEGVGGIAFYRMGHEDPGLWQSVGRGRVPDAAATSALTVPKAAPDAYQRIAYDLLRSEPGRAGKRRLHFNDGLGLITAASMEEIPVHVRFSGLHAAKRKAVALTFDDGPHPAVTPALLDILAARNVKATFYIVGANAARHPEIVHRMYAEGHDIGNHSYAHRDMATMSAQEIALDLNAVQRLLESQIGINSILFRAPYAASNYREFISAPQLMSTVSELGYLVGGIDVESYDYVLNRTSEQIRQRVVREALRFSNSVTVLMHDGGGSRKATLDAAGPIIDDLRAHGYEFVTTHELVGLERNAVMPRHAPAGVIEAASTQVRGQYMITLAQAGQAVGQVAILAAVLAVCRLLVIIVLAHVQRRREICRAGIDWMPPSIAVLVPAYNEEKVVCKTVQSLLASTIASRLEIVVIDDGSSDRTSEVVELAFAGDDRVRCLRKPNGGKAAALNYGVSMTASEILVAIDADTMLEPDAIELLVRHFHDASLGAVAGNAVVGNQANMLTRMQALEYVTSQNLERRAFEILNAIPVVPGAIGAWRRTAVLEAGGYANDTLAEDADLTIEIVRQGWKVIYEPRARALTEAPESLKGFLKQRFRWVFGTLQVACKTVLSGKKLPLRIALITIPNVFVFAFAFTLIAPVVDILLLLTIYHSLSGWVFDGGAAHLDTLGRIARYWLVFQAVDVMVACAAMRLDDDRSNFRLLPWIIVQRFTYRQLLYLVAIRALLAAVKGQFVGWGKLIRTGTVILPSPRT